MYIRRFREMNYFYRSKFQKKFDLYDDHDEEKIMNTVILN